MFKGIGFALFLPASILMAQSFVGSGYVTPVPVSVAPGQIATFFAAGLTQPYTGVTVTLQQGGSTSVPVLSVRPISLCPDASASTQSFCGTLAAVTLQIPYELATTCPACARPISVTPAELLISQNGFSGVAIEVNPVGDQVHVLTACDIALGSSAPVPSANLTGLPCSPLVTRADGGLVSASNPANPGEALTIWAFGLGITSPTSTTGQPSGMLAVAETFLMDYNYKINALPSKPFAGQPDSTIPQHPLYAGLAPGFAGLYQVNFIVPPGPGNGIARCALTGAFAAGGNVPQSNLTVSVGGPFSFDGAGICVATQIPVD